MLFLSLLTYQAEQFLMNRFQKIGIIVVFAEAGKYLGNQRIMGILIFLLQHLQQTGLFRADTLGFKTKADPGPVGSGIDDKSIA
jgi:hypothetical protein